MFYNYNETLQLYTLKKKLGDKALPVTDPSHARSFVKQAKIRLSPHRASRHVQTQVASRGWSCSCSCPNPARFTSPDSLQPPA